MKKYSARLKTTFTEAVAFGALIGAAAFAASHSHAQHQVAPQPQHSQYQTCEEAQRDADKLVAQQDRHNQTAVEKTWVSEKIEFIAGNGQACTIRAETKFKPPAPQG
jgi:hypothetical protein